MATAKKKTAAKAAEPVSAAMAAGQETLETAIQAGAEAFKGYEDVVSYGKDSVDAVMKSNALFVKGFQDINQALFGLAQASLDDSVAAVLAVADDVFIALESLGTGLDGGLKGLLAGGPGGPSDMNP